MAEAAMEKSKESFSRPTRKRLGISVLAQTASDLPESKADCANAVLAWIVESVIWRKCVETHSFLLQNDVTGEVPRPLSPFKCDRPASEKIFSVGADFYSLSELPTFVYPSFSLC
jgi:hypothetical protein